MTSTRAASPAPGLGDTKWLRRSFGAFATGVTVVTVGGDQPRGMTANSFTAVSLDPPLILVCIARDALMHEVLHDQHRFGISVLGAAQRDLAWYFASRQPLGTEQFRGVEHRIGQVSGAPLISGAAAHFECDVWRTYDGGDHTIFVGRVLTAAGTTDEDVLVFVRGKFDRLGLPSEPAGQERNR